MPCVRIKHVLQRGDAIHFCFKGANASTMSADIGFCEGFAQFRDIPADEQPKGKHQAKDWFVHFKPLEGLGNEGKAIGHDSVFTKLDVVETGRCPRLNGCTLFLALPDSYATWKPVEAVSGISNLLEDCLQGRAKWRDLRRDWNAPFWGVFRQHCARTSC